MTWLVIPAAVAAWAALHRSLRDNTVALPPPQLVGLEEIEEWLRKVAAAGITAAEASRRLAAAYRHTGVKLRDITRHLDL